MIEIINNPKMYLNKVDKKVQAEIIKFLKEAFKKAEKGGLLITIVDADGQMKYLTNLKNENVYSVFSNIIKNLSSSDTKNQPDS